MDVELGEARFLMEETTPAKGSFSLESVPGRCESWQSCREKFHPLFKEKTPGFYFSYLENQNIGAKVAAFIRKTESILEVSSFEFSEGPIVNFIMMPIKSKFSLTTRPFAMWVEPDIFWKKCWWRRSLFTILLRCGMAYDLEKENYEEALLTDPYAQDTHLAIKRFLFGYTTVKRIGPPSDAYGWREAFRFQPLDEIRKMLVREKEFPISIIGAGSIWN